MDNSKSLLAMSDTEIVVRINGLLGDGVLPEAAKAATNLIAWLKASGFSVKAWRSALDLSRMPVKAILENWSFDSDVIDRDFTKCLSRSVKYGNGGTTTRILGFDFQTRRVLTVSGSVYQLAYEREFDAEPGQLASADDYLWNHELAFEYVGVRDKDAHEFTSKLEWKTHPEGHSVYTDIYGVRIVHYFQQDTVENTGWGELFKENPEYPGTYDTERFETFECFVAYILAKYW